MVGGREVIFAEHVTVLERHDGAGRFARANFFTPDDQRNLDTLLRHRCKTRFELRALGRSGRVRLNRLVDSGRNATDSVDGGDRAHGERLLNKRTNLTFYRELAWRDLFGGGFETLVHGVGNPRHRVRAPAVLDAADDPFAVDHDVGWKDVDGEGRRHLVRLIEVFLPFHLVLRDVVFPHGLARLVDGDADHHEILFLAVVLVERHERRRRGAAWRAPRAPTIQQH